MHRLTVSLARMVPPTRRQVEVPSDLTLAGLHEVIQVLFDWDGDHLYEFVVGRRRYADSSWLDACEDDDVPLAEVAGRAGKVITYTYDLGACWEHRIVVDAVEPAGAGTRYPRCVAGVGPHPAEYDGDRPRRLDLDALDQQLAELPLQRKAPASAPAQAAATPQVRALAADARRASLLQDLVRLARWTATPRAVTATGVLKRPEVAGALQALRLPAPPAGFHSAKHLPHLDVCWRLAEDLDLIDISSKDAIPGPALAALDDDGQTLRLWTRLWELAAVDGRVLIYEGRALGHRWVTPPLLWALWRAQAPMSAAALDPLPRPDHDHVGFVAWVLDQLVAVGGVERLGDGRYQLTPLGRHGHLAVLDHDPRGGHGGEPMTDTAGFTVADLRSRAGEEAFRAAGEHVVAIDGPDEDEWSLSATVRLDDGRTLETILHHRVGGPLDGECDCPQALAGSFCSHLVLVGLAHLGVDAPAAAALATETAPAGDLRRWLAALSQRELIELVIEAAEEDRDYRRRLGLRSRTQAAQP